MTSGTRRWFFADQLGRHVLDDPDQTVLLIDFRAVFERKQFHHRKPTWCFRRCAAAPPNSVNRACFCGLAPTAKPAVNRRMSRPPTSMRRLHDLDKVLAPQRRLGEYPP